MGEVASVLMPEAPIHKNSHTTGGENKIRVARQVFAMQPKAKPRRM
jgi:hypothetical protein